MQGEYFTQNPYTFPEGSFSNGKTLPKQKSIVLSLFSYSMMTLTGSVSQLEIVSQIGGISNLGNVFNLEREVFSSYKEFSVGRCFHDGKDLSAICVSSLELSLILETFTQWFPS